jgi:hypothetical protein
LGRSLKPDWQTKLIGDVRAAAKAL